LTGGYFLSPAARAPLFVRHLFPRFADSPGATFCRPLRGLHSLFVIFPPGSPTHRGLLSVARCAGSTLCSSSFPPVRRLTGGYFLSPAARAPLFVRHLSPGSPTHRGLLSVARCAGSTLCSSSFPPLLRLTVGYFLSPAARAPLFVRHLSPGSPTHRGLLSVARCAGSTLCSSSFPRFPDSPGATFCRPLRGLHSLFKESPNVLESGFPL